MMNAAAIAYGLGETRAGRGGQARAPPEFHKKDTPLLGGARGVQDSKTNKKGTGRFSHE
jgi:hypothetical protein